MPITDKVVKIPSPTLAAVKQKLIRKGRKKDRRYKIVSGTLLTNLTP